MGCDASAELPSAGTPISIHAPQWGATESPAHGLSQVKISIHAPQWGATCRPTRRCSWPSNFNPRTPVGCDEYTTTPASCRKRFQSTHPSGVRPSLSFAGSSPQSKFQSTHPSGVRQSYFETTDIDMPISIHAPQWGATCTISQDTARVTYFNPRTPVGCDFSCKEGYYHRDFISIHAPQWGATAVTPIVAGVAVISIHAPQWGATLDDD